jgi:hypothetical protein
MNDQQKDLFDFNKQILFGEIGSVCGAPLFGWIASQMELSTTLISASAVIGSLVGGAVFWITTRVTDEKIKQRFSIKKFFSDILAFTPVAFIISFLTYQPVLFFLSSYLLGLKVPVLLAVVGAQVVAFLSFAIVINIYRYLLAKFAKKAL